MALFDCWKMYAITFPCDKHLSASGTTWKSQRLALSQSLESCGIWMSGFPAPTVMFHQDQAITY